MKMIKKMILTLPAIVMVLSFAAVPVQAHDGISGDDDTLANSSTHKITNNRSGVLAEAQKAEVHLETEKETENQNAERAKTELAKIEKAGHKKRSEETRKKNCQGLQHGLETKLTNLGKNAQKHQENIDKVLTTAEAYQAEHKVNGVDELITQAIAVQATSQASVVALQGLTVKIDCSDPNVPQTVAMFKAATASAHDNLQAYRKSVKAVLAGLEQIKQDDASQ